VRKLKIAPGAGLLNCEKNHIVTYHTKKLLKTVKNLIKHAQEHLDYIINYQKPVKMSNFYAQTIKRIKQRRFEEKR
jgi:hypothetical protein